MLSLEVTRYHPSYDDVGTSPGNDSVMESAVMFE